MNEKVVERRKELMRKIRERESRNMDKRVKDAARERAEKIMRMKEKERKMEAMEAKRLVNVLRLELKDRRLDAIKAGRKAIMRERDIIRLEKFLAQIEAELSAGEEERS